MRFTFNVVILSAFALLAAAAPYDKYGASGGGSVSCGEPRNIFP